ncbi:hypothetical protein F4808DRAFT_467112 [Astrocystis sublimbata]|nr:hypothetical protein F4808DRAFT_467112 [Astrocystis sublimbata]
MTSSANQQPANPASNQPTAPAVTSYASAAGAAKKPSSTPVVATGSNSPIVVAGSAPASNHAKSSSITPMNGRSNITPAVPTVAHGTSATSTPNGQPDHSRKSSVTMSANGPNSYSTNGAPAGPTPGSIKFGYTESPAPSHSTPQPPTAQVAIPGTGARGGVTEPRASPTPIPEPSKSGGRPVSGAAQSNATLAFGSFDNDRSHARTPSTSQDQNTLGPNSPHMRRGSNVSDISNHAGPQPGNMNRGGHSGGGRGGGRTYSSGGYNAASMGYPPTNNYNRGQQGNQGRGGMPANFAGNGRQSHHFGTPPQQNRSPHMAAAMPQPGPPMVPPGGQAMPGYYYPPPHMHQVPSQMLPFPFLQSFERTQSKPKKKGFRRESEKYSNPHQRSEALRPDCDWRQRCLSRRLGSRTSMFDESQIVSQLVPSKFDGSSASDSRMISLPPSSPLNLPTTENPRHPNPSPKGREYEQVLTSVKQGYPAPYAQGYGMQMPPHGYPQYPNHHAAQPVHGSPMTPYQQPVFVPSYNTGPQPMSRSNSQISDQRPVSSTGQSQAPVAHGTPQQQAAQLKNGPAFNRPVKRSMAVPIKNENGETIDLGKLKPPASPASTSQQSRTPPVIASTPTPPPKPSTPKSFVPAHGRTDSISNSKTAEEKRIEFMEKIKQTATTDKGKEDDTAKVSPVHSPADAQVKADDVITKTEVPGSDKEAVQEETKSDAQPKADAAAAAPAPKESAEPDEDEIERMIREMEEADALREKAEEELQAKRAAEAAAKKESAEKDRVANAAENDRKLREQEREMERLEEEKERKREEARAEEEKAAAKKNSESADASTGEQSSATTDATAKLASLNLGDKQSTTAGAKSSPSGRAPKPQALNLAPLATKSVEPPQPSAALQSLKTARLLDVIKTDIYPPGINSPNPALNAAVAKKGTSFKYDAAFLLQFKPVFTEQPSVDFVNQVQKLIGDGDGGRSASNRSGGGAGRSNSTRGGASGFPAMGNFGSVGSPLPSGTTSMQRFEASNKAMSGRPGINPMASFQRPGGAFGGGASMSRQASSNMGSMGPNSPRQSSRRNASKQNTMGGKSEAQAAKTMPLTAGLKIDALQTSSTGWKPTSIGKGAASSNLASQPTLMEPAMVQRKVKAALNKMTPENFDRISDQILEIAAQSKEETDGRTLRQVIQLTFEKATDEAHWASMYAKFCKKMLETMSPEVRDENIKDRNGNVVNGGALFRKYLLNRCQEEFERGWKIDLPKEEGTDGQAVLLSDEYYVAAAAKRRGLGLVQFIGELYKLGMLTERIMHECVRKLVDYSGIPDDAEVESLCKLLKTIGGNLDAAEKGKPMMDAYFTRIQSMIEIPGLASRLQFMLMDVVDLRKGNWMSKEANKGPKTLDEIRAEAEALSAQKAAEAARSNQRGGGGRAPLGRGDARHGGGFPQPVPNQVGMDDLRRLKGGASRPTSNNFSLAPMSMLGSRSNSGRRLGPGGALSRGADDSGASSRTGTPPVKEAPTSTNSFGLLATMDSDHPGSPPSTAASPALAKVKPETSAPAEKGEKGDN